MMRLNGTFAAFLAWVLLIPSTGCSQDRTLETGLESLVAGSYEDARQVLRDHVGTPADSAGLATIGFLETFLAAGNYSDGLTETQSVLSRNPDSPYAHYMQGRLLVATGNLEAADSTFRRAAALKRNYWRNALSLAELLDKTGRQREANQIFSAILNAYKLGYFKTAETLMVAGRSAAFVEEFRDANNAFSTAHELNPQNTQNLIWWGDLFRDKYNNADAERTYEDALAVNPNRPAAWIGLAAVSGSFTAKEKHTDRALTTNPNYVPGLAVRASLRLLDGQYGEAQSILNEALDINPASLDALAHLAAVQHLLADTAGFRITEARALELYPTASEFYVTIADDLALRFRYPAAAEISRKAVNLEPSNPKALTSLGTSLLRLGETTQAKRYLTRSFDRDGFNLFVGNTLTLLDEYQYFDTIESEHFRVLIHQDESAVLGADILREAEDAYTSMSARYSYRPADKILIEAYNDRDDFAVRIAGVPHLGLLGVSFGDVVAINTPRAQGGNDYNWARTLWHEIGHTMAIGVSRNHVPRWFTEGLSVYEEKLEHKEWAREMEVEFFAALDRDRLHSLENIDRGFTRPEFPGQVLLSYFHASKIIEYIAETYEFDAVTAILESLAEGNTMPEAIQQATGVSLETLDDAFQASIKSERSGFAHLLDDMPDPLSDEGLKSIDGTGKDNSRNEFLIALRGGYAALQSGDLDQAETLFNESIQLYPTFVHDGNAYDGLARVYRQRGETDKLQGILSRLLDVTDYGVEQSIELASIHADKGDLDTAVSYLGRSIFVDPYNREVRSELANLYDRLNIMERAIEERRAVLALNPVDRAEAYFQLADVLFRDGRTDQAKRAVLQSLEIAPGYREAQQLLLACVDE